MKQRHFNVYIFSMPKILSHWYVNERNSCNLTKDFLPVLGERTKETAVVSALQLGFIHSVKAKGFVPNGV